MAKRKSAEAEAENGGIGHNSELSDEERRALFFDHYRKIERQTGRLNIEREELKTLRKTAKADAGAT